MSGAFHKLKRRIDRALEKRCVSNSSEEKNEKVKSDAPAVSKPQAAESVVKLPLGPEGPLVTIVVPFYRDVSYIRWTLESVIQQTYKNFECILVDDCGEDGTSAIAEEFEKRDERFRIIRHDRNSGLAAARNTGIKHARGSYIQFLDADDMLFKDAIEKRLLILMEVPRDEVAGCYCHVQLKSASFSDLKSSEPWKEMKIADFINSAGDCPFSCHAPLLKTEIVVRFGGFDTNLVQAEDYDLWMRIMRHGYCFVPSMTVSGIYRMKPSGSMAVAGAKEHLAQSMAIFDSAHNDFDPDKGIADTPFVYRKPWVYYANAVRKSARILRFSSMLADREKAAAILAKYLPDDTLYAVERHARATKFVNDGVGRSAGLVGTSLPANVADYFMRDIWVLAERQNIAAACQVGAT
jgi:glycosyltransferase involved in cell wall biosynthesis